MVCSSPFRLTFACASLMLSTISIVHPNYHTAQWQVFAVTCLLLIANGIVASLPTIFLTRVTRTGAVINTLSLLAFLVVIPVASLNTPKFASAPEVWGTFRNGTDWPLGFAVLMSFLAVIWTLSGYDAPFHLTEECANSAVAAPRAIVTTSSLGALVGWFLVLLIGYTTKDIDAIFASSLNQPMAGYLLQALGMRGASGLLSVIIICLYFCGQSCMIVSSRLLFAYSRDGALPGSRIWSRVSPRTKTPVFAGSTMLRLHLLILCLPQLLHRDCPQPPRVCRTDRYRRNILRWGDCSVCGLPDSYCSAGHLSPIQFPTRSLEYGNIFLPVRCCGDRVDIAHCSCLIVPSNEGR